MGKLLICVVIGYLLGCINPAYLISKMKDKDITNRGTGNLGTTNAFINFGKVYGVLVLICDMGKAVLAVVVSRYLNPDFLLGGIVAGSMAVIGHILPFYNGFRGGTTYTGIFVYAYNGRKFTWNRKIEKWLRYS